MKRQLPHSELGCYGDGSFGHQHTRERCADVLLHYRSKLGASKQSRVVAELRGEMSDDASEEDDACDWLNKHVPFDGAYWGWKDGDFGLWEEDSKDG